MLLRPPRRPLLVAAVLVALLGACGSEDDDGEALGDVCALLDPADLEDVTGVPFEDQEGGEASCTYISSTGAAIALNVADVRGAAEAGLGGAQSTCDDGTAEEIDIADTDGAFTCLVTGLPTVAAVGGGGYLVVLTGDDADTEVDDATITDSLVTILESSIASR